MARAVIQPYADAGGVAAVNVCTIRTGTPVDIDGIFGVASPDQPYFLATAVGSRFQQMLEKFRKPAHTRERSSGAAAFIGNLMRARQARAD